MSTVASFVSASEIVKLPAVQYRSQETSAEKIVRMIQAGAPEGADQLHTLLDDGIRFFLSRSLGSDIEADAASVFSTVLQAIRRGDLRDPNGLVSLARNAVKDRVFARNLAGEAAANSGTNNRSQIEIARSVLAQASQRDREVLHRFFVQGQAPARIMSEMGLTSEELTTIRARARARFAELERRSPAH